MRRFITSTPRQYSYNDQVKGGEMGRTLLRTGEERNAYRISLRNREGKRPLERLDVIWGIILKRFLEELVGVIWSGFI
jgi:hypothetical protein